MGDADRVVVVRGPGDIALVDVPRERLPAGGLRVETLYTGLSAGTELTWVKGTNPYLTSSWDPQLGLFRPDAPGQGYPVTRLGYMEVGRVVRSDSPAYAEGQRVAMAYGHKTAHAADPAAEHIVALPEELDPLLGVYVAHMGPICANGLLHAAADATRGDVHALGDGVRGRTVLVTGAGVVGLFTALFAQQHGAAAVAVADRTPARLAAAEGLGLLTLDENTVDVAATVKSLWRHGPADHGADVAFQCRGQAASLATALRALRPQGTVIDLAFYQAGADEVRLGEEFHHNGLGVRCAQIGRVPRGLAHLWDRRRLSAETLALLADRGRDIRTHLVTDVLALAEAPDFLLDLAERRRHTISAVFTVDAPSTCQASRAL